MLSIRVAIIACSVLSASALLGETWAEDSNDNLRLNEIQIIGTHNSYHAGLAPGEAKLLARSNPAEAAALEYKHPSLAQQLEEGNRELELDVYPDSTGGRYASSRALTDVLNAGLPPDDPHFYQDGLMLKPGFKVMHKPDSDYRSNCQPFTACLREIHKWSVSHPGHLPIFLFIETKIPATLRASDFDALDAEVRSVFPTTELIVPEDILGKYRSLREAVQSEGWPTLKHSRGKMIFLMAREEVADVYRAEHPQLKGRVMFVNGRIEDSDTIFSVQPKNHGDSIQRLVRDGLLVYTRCDADTVEARAGDTTRRENAFASGAQILSTDYPASEPAIWSGYTVQFPGHLVAHCNPVLKSNACSVEGFESTTNQHRIVAQSVRGPDAIK